MSTIKVLSIRQPWAFFISIGWKPIENRTWATKFRGRFLIHAGLGMTRAEYEGACECAVLDCGIDPSLIPAYEALPRGGIVGEAVLTGCVTASPSPWFFGPAGFELAEAKQIPFIPLKGRLGFFDVTLSILQTNGEESPSTVESDCP